jgi:ABC-type transport system involved in multi-copper enzyme maturation permease subunit
MGPIFHRELLTVPRRSSHYVARVAWLTALLVLAITAWLAILGWAKSSNLGETARFGPLLFRLLSFFQLALFLFFSALACASAIAKEKDRRTFILLLMTDLSDFEIVLGKVFGSLLSIFTMLLLALPILFFLPLLGGVGLEPVIQSALVIAATTFAAGALGGVVALWRDRTFQSLALTLLFLVLYLLPILLIRPIGNALGWDDEALLYVQQMLEPFHAMAGVHESTLYEASESGLLSIAPAYAFVIVMFIVGVALTIFSVWRLRVWNPSGEPIMQRESIEAMAAKQDEPKEDTEAERVNVHAAPGAVRLVNGNPILWREVFTRAYGRRPVIVKLAYGVVLALICLFALGPLFGGEAISSFTAGYGLLPVGVLSLLLVAAQATTAITSERDTGALDLLLVTDLSAKEFIFGKILGILYNTKEYLVPPLILAGIYAFYGCLAIPPKSHPELQGPMNATALLSVLGAALTLMFFATVLGIHVALRTPNSQLAIVNALSTIFFLTVGTLICISLILINRRFEYQWGSFVFFLFAGIGGLWYVLSGDRPTAALSWASWACPLAVLYAIMTILVGKPGSNETGDPLIPAGVMIGAFGFAIAAMLVPLVSEFDVAMGRTSGGAD